MSTSVMQMPKQQPQLKVVEPVDSYNASILKALVQDARAKIEVAQQAEKLFKEYIKRMLLAKNLDPDKYGISGDLVNILELEDNAQTKTEQSSNTAAMEQLA